MFRIVRPRSMILLGAAVVGFAVVAGVVLFAGEDAQGKDLGGDPGLKTVSVISVCSDVKVHAWVTVNIGTVAQPDDRKVDYDVGATGHDHDPFGRTLAKGCDMAAGAFGSRVEFKAAGLNGGRPFYATAPADRRHVLVVRLTQHADGTVTSTQELIAAR
ncbi:hypothetical protein ABZ848_46250 [Streptomyces sp. NPDC047081]|uniref:hypothetical protein n=1 Tax=Streptomyces sp. NPDC047081 TaxID=3154706 RepID=UPI0033F7C9DB